MYLLFYVFFCPGDCFYECVVEAFSSQPLTVRSGHKPIILVRRFIMIEMKCWRTPTCNKLVFLSLLFTTATLHFIKKCDLFLSVFRFWIGIQFGYGFKQNRFQIHETKFGTGTLTRYGFSRDSVSVRYLDPEKLKCPLKKEIDVEIQMWSYV